MKSRLGLFRRRECLVPTFRGWLLILLLLAGTAWALVLGVYPFLAVNDPKPGGVLVIEGWGSEDVMNGVIAEFHRGKYETIFVTGGPIEDSSPLAQYENFAQYGAVVLKKMGVDPNAVHAVPTPKVVRDRTYSSAVALRKWLQAQGKSAQKVNVYSAGAHSRRSRLLFEKAFRGEAEIGVVTTEDQDFDPKHWWRTSVGFRNVTGEIIAYLYARFIFRPPED